MGITTRGGKARVLEYEKNDDLVTKETSLERIYSLLLCSSTFFNIWLLICILTAFNIGEIIRNLEITDEEIHDIPSKYLMSITNEFEIFLYPIKFYKNRTYQMETLTRANLIANFSNFNFTTPYIYRGELYFIFGRAGFAHNKFCYLKKAFDTTFLKKFYYDGFFLDHVPSFVQVGSIIWLFGKFRIISIIYMIQLN